MADQIPVDRTVLESMLKTLDDLTGDLGSVSKILRDLSASVSTINDTVQGLYDTVERLLETPSNGGVGSPSTPPPVTDDLIGEWSDIKTPVKLSDGIFKDALTYIGVLKASTPGSYEKLLGAASTAPNTNYGGVCIGLQDDGDFEWWFEDPVTHGMKQGIIPGMTAGRRYGFVVRIHPSEITGAVTVTKIVDMPNGYVPPDGETWLGKGIYKGQWVDALKTAELVKLTPYRTALTDEQIATIFAGWSDLINGVGSPPTPPNGGNGGNGGGEPPPVDPEVIQPKPTTPPPVSVKVGASSDTLNAAAPYALIKLDPGRYRFSTINVKEGQRYQGNPSDPGSVILDGGSMTGVAFYAGGDIDGIKNVKYVTIEGLTITAYSNGMPRNFNVKPTGNDKDAKAQFAAINRPGFGWIVQDCDIIANYMSGVHNCMDGRISRCTIADNGSCGIAGGSELHKEIIEDCDIYNNARWHLNPHWEAGGIKNSRSVPADAPYTGEVVYRRCRIWNNWGSGIWHDYQGYGGEIHHCSIWGNSLSGVQVEVGCAVHVHHCQIGHNADKGSGIFRGEIGFQNAKKCVFEKNLVYVSKNGSFFVGQQERGGTPFVGYATAHRNVIRDNVFCITGEGTFDYLHDWGGPGRAPAPGVHLPKDLIQDHWTFIAAPGSGNTLLVDFNGNTIRHDSGSFQINSRYGPKNTKFGKDPTSFEPDWKKIPTWETPPGAL